jgi:uncharacterized protein
MTQEERVTLLEFPCEFPIKIMGAHVDGFPQMVLDVVLTHAPDFDANAMQTRPSAQGNYLAITCTLTATSQAQLDALYRELSSHPMVKVVL